MSIRCHYYYYYSEFLSDQHSFMKLLEAGPHLSTEKPSGLTEAGGLTGRMLCLAELASPQFSSNSCSGSESLGISSKGCPA